jgi:signal transduction histidine kinase
MDRIDKALSVELMHSYLPFEVYQFIIVEIHSMVEYMTNLLKILVGILLTVSLGTVLVIKHILKVYAKLTEYRTEIETIAKFRADEHSAILKGVSHELNSPISGIQMMADTMASRHQAVINALPISTPCCLECRGRKVLHSNVSRLELISSTCVTAKNILSSLSNYSDLVRKEQLTRVSIKELLRNSIRYSKFLDEHKRVAEKALVFVDYCPDHDLMVDVIPTEVITAIQNIISNSLRAIMVRQEQEPDLKPKMIISVESDSAFVTVEIGDNGIGMSKELTVKSKELFYTTNVNGSGIGMFIIDRNFKRSNINYYYHSIPGDGTVCSFRILCMETKSYSCLNRLIGMDAIVQNTTTGIRGTLRCLAVETDKLILKISELLVDRCKEDDVVIVTLQYNDHKTITVPGVVCTADSTELHICFNPSVLIKLKDFASTLI